MSDYFRFYCDGLDEPRFLYAMHQSTHVPVTWLWVLCECARTKKNQIQKPTNAMLVGLQHKLNVPPGSVQLCLNLLVEIDYLEEADGTYIVRKWNDLQSKYMQEKAWKESHRNQKEPKETKNPIGEERRGEERTDKSNRESDPGGCLKVTFKGDLVTGDAPTVERSGGFTLQECLDASVAIGMPREDVEAFFAHYDQYDWIGSQGRKITKLPSALAKWKSQRQNHAPKQVGRANGQTPVWARKKAAEEALAPLRNKNYPTNEQAAEMRRLKKIIAECNAELSA